MTTTATTARLTGYPAIQYAEHRGLLLGKYTDPIEDAREDMTPAEARRIAEADPLLIYIDAPAPSFEATGTRASEFADECPGAIDVDIRASLPTDVVDGTVTMTPNQADPSTYEAAGSPDAWISPALLAAIAGFEFSATDYRTILLDLQMTAATAAEAHRE